MAYNSFENLHVWKKACRLAVDIYGILSDCPDYALKGQMTRAAVSIASNIAEGAERDTTPDYIRFLHIAKGSAAELRTQFYIAQEVQLLQEDIVHEKVADLKEISAMLHGLIKSLKS